MKNNYKINILYIGFILLLLQCLSFSIKGQVTTFQKIYPSTYDQDGLDASPTPDGGYIIAGCTTNNILNDLDVYIVKTSNSGNILWTKTYGGNKPDYPNSILQIKGGYFIIGYTQSFGPGDFDVYLLKINNVGDTLWTKTYGGSGYDEGKEIVPTSDGNYVIAASSNSLNLPNTNNSDMQLIKIDTSGNVIWTKNYGSANFESARSVKLCKDKGFILAGRTANTNSSIGAKIYLVKTDSVGDTTWTKTFGGPDSYEGKYILANNDGTYTLCIDDSSGARDSDVGVMNISANGSIINWNKTYGGTVKDISKMIQPTPDGGYIVAGISRSFGWINPDMWLLKLNSGGDTLWTRHYGGPGHEHCYSARPTADGGFIAVGHSKSYTPNTEIMLVKVGPSGTLTSVPVEEFSSDNSMNVYPNPTYGIITIDLDTTVSSFILRISNVLGHVIYSELVDSSNHKGNKIIDLQNNDPGIYFLTIQSATHSITKKVVLK